MLKRVRLRYRWGSPPWWLQLLIIVPELAAGLLPLILIVAFFGSREQAFLIVVALVALWLMASHPRIEPRVAIWALKLRRPTPAERIRLTEAVRHVATQLDIRFPISVLIERSDGINAKAFGRTVLAVTDQALELDDAHLTAIVAHEIGHLDEGHTLFGVLRMLALIPLRVYNEIGGFLSFASPATALVGFPIIIVTSLLSLPIYATDLLYRPVARWKERSADLYASRCGYGIELARILDDGGPQTRSERLRSMFSQHPSGRVRAARLIEAEIRAVGETRKL